MNKIKNNVPKDFVKTSVCVALALKGSTQMSFDCDSQNYCQYFRALKYY